MPRPVARLGLEIGISPRKSATSVSTACVSRAREPLRKISVSESLKVSGCASWMTLVSATAYHSFGGEVSNPPRYAALPLHAVTNFRA
jgi:hypothetical protein